MDSFFWLYTCMILISQHRLNVEFVYTPLSKATPQQKAQGGNGVPTGDEEGGDESFVSDGGVDGVDGEEGYAEGVGNSAGGGKKKRVRHPKLPDKPTDFQVRYSSF